MLGTAFTIDKTPVLKQQITKHIHMLLKKKVAVNITCCSGRGTFPAKKEPPGNRFYEYEYQQILMVYYIKISCSTSL
jgi:hypothetical protein